MRFASGSVAAQTRGQRYHWGAWMNSIPPAAVETAPEYIRTRFGQRARTVVPEVPVGEGD